MKENQTILDAWRTSQKLGESCVLVTVVKTQGSTYRKAGARMLVTFDRKTHGMVSGGCLEQLLSREAFERTATQKTVAFSFENSPEDDDLRWASGCHGTFHVLLERIDTGDIHAGLELLDHCQKQRKTGVLATVAASSVTEIEIGVSLSFVDGVATQSEWSGEIGKKLGQQVVRDVNAYLPAKHEKPMRAANHAYEINDAKFEILINPITPPPRLLLCGSGPDAQPLARLATELGWQTIVFDTRAKSATSSRFPGAAMVMGSADLAAEYVDPWTAGVIMTHRFADDVDLLRCLLFTPLPYLGILGPRARTERILAEINPSKAIAAEDVARLHCPIGLDIGAESPEQIALAIIAEIQATLSWRSALFLKDKAGPLHIHQDGTLRCNG